MDGCVARGIATWYSRFYNLPSKRATVKESSLFVTRRVVVDLRIT